MITQRTDKTTDLALPMGALLLLLLLTAALANAAESPSAMSLSQTTPPQKRSLDATSTKISVSPGATVYRDTDGFQTTVSIMERMTSGIYLGMETSFMRWLPHQRADYKGMPEGLTALPLMISMIYRFENDAGVHPYLGASAGIALLRKDLIDGNDFQLLTYFRSGAEFELSSNVAITLEPRIGMLGDHFVFSPQVGLTLSL